MGSILLCTTLPSAAAGGTGAKRGHRLSLVWDRARAPSAAAPSSRDPESVPPSSTTPPCDRATLVNARSSHYFHFPRGAPPLICFLRVRGGLGLTPLSASSTNARATRSLTLPLGLRFSSLTRTAAEPAGTTRFRGRIGVRPTSSSIFWYKRFMSTVSQASATPSRMGLARPVPRRAWGSPRGMAPRPSRPGL